MDQLNDYTVLRIYSIILYKKADRINRRNGDQINVNRSIFARFYVPAYKEFV